MGTQTDSMITDDTSHLRAGIAKTRSDMGETIEQLHGRLNPSVLKEQALEQFHDLKETVKAEVKAELNAAAQSLRADVKSEIADVKTKLQNELDGAKTALREATIGKVETMVHNAQEKVRETSNSFIDTVRANPIPAALAGVGLTWLLINRGKSARLNPARGSSARGDSTRLSNAVHTIEQQAGQALHRAEAAALTAASSVAQQASSVVHQAGDMAANVAHQAGGMASNVAHQAGDLAANMAHNTQAAAAQVAQSAVDRLMLVKLQATRGYQANPLPFGAGVFVLGAAVGLAMPMSKREEQLLAPAHDSVIHKAESLVHDTLGKVQDATKQVVGDVAHALTDAAKGGSTGSPTKKPNAPQHGVA